MPVKESAAVVVLDMAEGVTARSLVYDDRSRTFLTPPRPTSAYWSREPQVHAGATGEGVIVGIIDSGVMWEHPALRGRRIASANFASSADDQDRHGHGTLMALLIQMLAPDVSFISAKVVDDYGRGNRASLKAGMKWAASEGAVLLNVSVGYADRRPTKQCACSVCSLANELVLGGTGVCAALGNDPTFSYHPGSAQFALTVGVIGKGGVPEYVRRRAGAGMKWPDFAVPQYELETPTGRFDGATSMGSAFTTGQFAGLTQMMLDAFAKHRAEQAFQSAAKDLAASKAEGADAINELGLAKQRARDLQEALTLFRAASALDPENLGIQMNLGYAYAQIGDLRTAERLLSRLRDKGYRSAEMHAFLGLIYTDLGRPADAKRSLREALEIDPQNQFVLANRAAIEKT